jgi:hypothetical protein
MQVSPSTGELIKKMWFLYIMEFYSATRRMKLSFAGKWMDPTGEIILSEVSHAQKAKSLEYC